MRDQGRLQDPSRRRLLGSVVVASAWGGLVWAVGERVARAGIAPSAGSEATTTILSSGTVSSLSTGPLLVDWARDTRVGACLVVAGGGPQSHGESALVEGVAQADLIVDAAGPIKMQADPGAEHAARRVLAGLELPGEVELFGFAASPDDALSSPSPASIRWEARLRPGMSTELSRNLRTWHGWIFGELSKHGTFADRLSFVRVRNVVG